MPKFAHISKICEKLEKSRNLNSSVEAGRKDLTKSAIFAILIIKELSNTSDIMQMA